jgi:hypothetical protein
VPKKPEYTVTFTGSRHGLSPPQRTLLDKILEDHHPTLVRHGGCIGGDEEFHRLALASRPQPKVQIYPSNLPDYLHGTFKKPLTQYPRLPPLERNRIMVDLAANDEYGLVLACPRSLYQTEEPRSETWATVRYSIDIGVKLYIIKRNGTWETHGAFLSEREQGDDDDETTETD